MTYILGEVSSPFGAHGRGAHNVRSSLGALFSHASRFKRQRLARVVDSDANEIPTPDQGQLGYILGEGADNATRWAATGSYMGEVSSPFGAHGRGAHTVRGLGEVSSPFGAHGRGAHEVRSALGGGIFHGLGATEGGKAPLVIAKEKRAAAKAGGTLSASYLKDLETWAKLFQAASDERAAVLGPIEKQIKAAQKVPIIGPGLVKELNKKLKGVAEGLRPLPPQPERPKDAFKITAAGVLDAGVLNAGGADDSKGGIPPLAIAAGVAAIAAFLFLRKG